MADKIRSNSQTTAGGQNNIALHIVPRGEIMDDGLADNSEIIGYDSGRMKARALLTDAEEKKLMRRVDLHLMPLTSSNGGLPMLTG
ncbi:hypothetical protein RBB50_012868 [Rhinocladiella similis]